MTKKTPIARHGRLRSPHPLRTVATTALAAVAVLGISGVTLGAYAAWDVTRSIQTVSLVSDQEAAAAQASGADGADIAAAAPAISAIDGGVNLLLVGSDSRTGQGDAYGDDEGAELNDVTMLMHIAQDHSSATVVSFPRDLVVDLPECPEGGGYTAPINESLGQGGLACTVLTVESLTGLSIPFAAEIQFNGVIEMSNAVGGVPVCVAEVIDDPFTGVYLEPGTHPLKGADALGFLRTRHGVGDGSDIGRISSQQVFLSSLVRTVKSDSTLTDFGKLYGLAKAAASNMTLSDRLASPDTMVSIALALKDMDLSKVTFVAYPNFAADWVPEGKVAPDSEAADILFAAILADQPVAVAAPGGVASVVDPASPGAPDAAAPVDPSAPADPTDPSAPIDPAAPVAPAAPAPAPGTVLADGSTLLPDSVKGQTAADYTCSVGNE
ncbi:LCP family protein [Herbiconiux sp. VKM Ac-2851]|uniref:LCP family protein n=1 Tax=Herbiconiux sp. VKM Ac-2851 TaxID=2739025 RepID=UPI0015653202|nr:LCP family protein [Herbiconiux sp. VKM Ac-2851]NQX34576.1 LCP family protein [Herbiconiux sp. VKM Ac-2851]